jgi:hypothetical protein
MDPHRRLLLALMVGTMVAAAIALVAFIRLTR